MWNNKHTLMQTITQRVKQIIDNEHISVRQFEDKISVGQGTVNKAINANGDLKGSVLNRIVDIFPQYCAGWLLTGKGNMYVNSDKNSYSTENVNIAPNPIVNDSKIALLNAEKEKVISIRNGIPLVSTEAVAGFGNMDFAIREQDIQGFYKVPDFVNINFMIRVKGSSMYPKYNSGDVVACRIIRDSHFIQWNKVHVIATTEQGILIKRLKKGETSDSLLVVSDNKDYDPFEIPKIEITGLALVVGVIRLE